MEKTPESVASEIATLKHMLSEVSTAVDEYAEIATCNVGIKSPAASGQVNESHTALFLKTHNLLRTVRGPVDMVISNIENSAHSGCLRAVMEMGVFEALPMDGSSATAEMLATKLAVEKDLLVRLMRNLTVVGPFAEIYMIPAITGLFKVMCDEIAPANAKLYEFFRTTGFKSPDSQLNNPYCNAHQTGKKTLWEYLKQYPERFSAFNAAQQASNQASWTTELFPFESELQKFDPNDETVLLVDIGGGRGHVTQQIKGLIPNVKGRLVLQDRPEVIVDITELLTGIEKMEYDFFTPQPIQGALIYYIRHCLHDWSEKDCIRILRQIAPAIKPGASRLIISDSVLPEMGADVESGWIKTQWAKILDESGFKLHKVYSAPGTYYASIEAYLKY